MRSFTVSATTTAQTLDLGGPTASLLLSNLGAGDCYVKFFYDDQDPTAAVSTDALIVAGSATAPISLSITKGENTPGFYRRLSILSASTTTVRVLAE